MTNHPNRGKSIYQLYDAAFANVSAYIVARQGERVATIAFKFPRDGAGRMYAYVHWLGLEMVRGHAGKKSAACCAAVKRGKPIFDAALSNGDIASGGLSDADSRNCHAFIAALAVDDERGWEHRLRDAGFAVWRAV